MNKIAKRIVAGASAMALAFSSVAMTASAADDPDRVNGIIVDYSSSITSSYVLSTSSFRADPKLHSFELYLDMFYVHINQRNGEVTASNTITPIVTGGGTGRQIMAPTNCTMKRVETDHYFSADGVIGVYSSSAER